MEEMAGPERMDSVCRVKVVHQMACDTRPRLPDGTLDRDPSSRPKSCWEACPARQALLRPVPQHVTRSCYIPKWFKCPYGHSCCWATVRHITYGSSGCTCDRAQEAEHSYVEKPLPGLMHNTWYPLTASSEAARASTSDVSDPRGPLAGYLSAENLSGLTATSATPKTNVASNFPLTVAALDTPGTTAASNSSLNAATPATPETAVTGEDDDVSRTTLSTATTPSMAVTPSTAATPSAAGTPVTESILSVRVGSWPGWVNPFGLRPPPGFTPEDCGDKNR
ncbi:hypothetical protein B0H65DRAFT_540274 [Neurospora tetraspora]|uniref:Uncharacterized protein n=1 Tax=Neurospora tetraspora TaxID=94610 RepID=A0AAE0MR36_9PEZI|nr:hypothetical protein B0H65DRAFT_540274 [Neurospora tetraspora]